MKKITRKVFWVLFSILTLFLISILFYLNYQDYQKEKDNIKNSLTRLNNDFYKNNDSFIKPNNSDENTSIKDNLQQKIFLDLTVYTVLLDKNNNIIDIISHNEIEDYKDTIKEVAENILKNSKTDIKISNLYLDDYSYYFQNNLSLTIVDNKVVKMRLLSTLTTSLLIFFCLEIVIILLSIGLTNWLIKPIEESFNKQKQFIADASHELKTPLSVIIASAEALENNPQEIKWLNNIKSESVRMNKLISNLLDLAKSENNSSKELYTLNNLSKIVTKSVLTFESLIYENNLSLDYQIEENINFKCNSEEIKQLVGIILDNAIKHSTKNSQIKVNLQSNKQDIILDIVNQGKPIPKEEEEKIFERFYRTDTSRNRRDNRYGLGLAIAKNIVTNHNGTIKASSKDGYTTFKVIFKKK
jgi:signal transduction histidine kinase